MNTSDQTKRFLNVRQKGTMNVRLFDKEFKIGNEEALNIILNNHIEQTTNTLYLAHHNLHSLALCQSHASMQSYFDTCSYIWIDGMPLIWMFKLLGYDVDNSWRITFLDWDKSLFSNADKKKWRIFVLGTSEKNNRSAVSKLANLYPNINFEGHHGYIPGYSNSDQSALAVKKINDFQTDILLVAMGMPLQEIWIDKNRAALKAKVILPIGGYLDYICEAAYTPPRWAGKYGLEWLMRLIRSPRRLGYRYMVEPWAVLLSFLIELFQRKTFKSSS